MFWKLFLVISGPIIHQLRPQTSHFRKSHEFQQGIGAEIAYLDDDFLITGFLLRINSQCMVKFRDMSCVLMTLCALHCFPWFLYKFPFSDIVLQPYIAVCNVLWGCFQWRHWLQIISGVHLCVSEVSMKMVWVDQSDCPQPQCKELGNVGWKKLRHENITIWRVPWTEVIDKLGDMWHLLIVNCWNLILCLGKIYQNLKLFLSSFLLSFYSNFYRTMICTAYVAQNKCDIQSHKQKYHRTSQAGTTILCCTQPFWYYWSMGQLKMHTEYYDLHRFWNRDVDTFIPIGGLCACSEWISLK